MKRLFTVGCSHTLYPWPTYADILSKDYDEYYNYGLAGIGNYAIFIRLLDIIKNFDLTKDDTLILQWTNPHRFDFYKEPHGWYLGGNLAYLYDDVQKTIAQYCWEERSWEKVSSHLYFAADIILNSLDATTFVLSYDIDKEHWLPCLKSLEPTDRKFKRLLNANGQAPNTVNTDHHYTPSMHLDYLTNHSPFKISEKMLQYVRSAEEELENVKDHRRLFTHMYDKKFVQEAKLDLK